MHDFSPYIPPEPACFVKAALGADFAIVTSGPIKTGRRIKGLTGGLIRRTGSPGTAEKATRSLARIAEGSLSERTLTSKA